MISQQFLVCDSSTLANFKGWAQAIDTFFSTSGWAQSSDTGQVNWSTLSTVPGSGAYVYSIWQPNDGLTNFYVKMEYGNTGGAANPSIRITIGTTTNGAGTLGGFVIGPQVLNPNTTTSASTTATYECDFSGAAGRIGALLWRTGPTGNTIPQLFAIERSVNSSGSYTSSHVTLFTNSTASNRQYQATIVFGVGVPPNAIPPSSNGGWIARVTNLGAVAFNGSIPLDTCAPFVGFFDQPLTMVGISSAADLAEGITFTLTLYGSTRTYLPTKVLGSAIYQGGFGGCVCMRYD
jgi:hypothetical protein